MSEKGFDLYLVQHPDTAWPYDDNAKVAMRNTLKYYDGSIAIKSIWEFICQVKVHVATKNSLIKTLVIGSHGGATKDFRPSEKSYGYFNLGEDSINEGDEQIDLFRQIAYCFTKDARVYLMACRTGNDQTLMRPVSTAL